MNQYVLYYKAPSKPNAYLVGDDIDSNFVRSKAKAKKFSLQSAAETILKLPQGESYFDAELCIEEFVRAK